MSTESDVEIDFHTKQPRRKRIPYSFMPEEQIQNIRKNNYSLFFRDTSPPPDVTRQYKDRWSHFHDRSILRGINARDVSYMDEHITKDLPLLHNTSRPGAAFRWGPEKIGHKTIRNYLHQDCFRFLNIDCYKRNPTCYPGEISHIYGHAAPGYKAERNPNSNTWFGSDIKLNKSIILENIGPKPTIYYDSKLKNEMSENGKFNPYLTTYDECLRLRRKIPRKVSGREGRLIFQELARKGLA